MAVNKKTGAWILGLSLGGASAVAAVLLVNGATTRPTTSAERAGARFSVTGVMGGAKISVFRLRPGQSQHPLQGGSGSLVDAWNVKGTGVRGDAPSPISLAVNGPKGVYVAVEELTGGRVEVSSPVAATGQPFQWIGGRTSLTSRVTGLNQPKLMRSLTTEIDDHGPVTFSDVNGQWSATWAWGPGVAGFAQWGQTYPALSPNQTVFLLGVANEGGTNPADSPNAPIETFAWATVGSQDSVTVPFTPPAGLLGSVQKTWDQGGEVFEMHTVSDHLESVAGQLPEVPLAVALPVVAGAVVLMGIRRRQSQK